MANHGPAYGLSKEIQMKNASRFCIEDAREVLHWIEDVIEIAFPTDVAVIDDEIQVADLLKDGTGLCMLANRLLPNDHSIDYIKKPKMPFHKMENISKFLDGIKQCGVAEISCFQTVDLYEAKQMFKVIECLRALAGVAQKNGAAVPIPQWAVKLSNANRRRFTPDVLSQSNAVISLQYGTNKGASQTGMRPYGLGRQIMPSSK